MHARRWIAIATTVGAVLFGPIAARADGGAYIEFNRTHYLPGGTATGDAYVYLQKQHQGLLDRGPFYAYLLTDGATVRRGHPIPAGAIRLGTFTVDESRPKWFELKVSFTVPDLIGDFYTVAVCNDPCTISGFKEPLSGLVSIVQTTREGALLTQRQRLYGRIYAVRRQAKKSERALAELSAQFDASDRVRSAMASELSSMEDRLAAATAAASGTTRDRTPRPLLAPEIGIALVLVLLVLAAAVAARGRPGPSEVRSQRWGDLTTPRHGRARADDQLPGAR
ncbi:MAG: hypothetical protein ACXWYT_06615 [Actinomycetota bacterium]